MQEVESVRPISSRSALILLALPTISICIALASSARASAQEPSQSAELASPAFAPVVPQQVRYSGKLASRPGDTVEAVFRIYASPEGGDPLWTETQQVTAAEDGSYSVLLGSSTATGLPQSVFANGAARWLSVSIDRAEESTRTLLSSVPYAMESADAQSLAGRRASDFVTQTQLAQFLQSLMTATQIAPLIQQPLSTPKPLLSPGALTGAGTANYIPLWNGTYTQGSSAIEQLGANTSTTKAAIYFNGYSYFFDTTSLIQAGTATTATGYGSSILDFIGSVWSSTTAAPVLPHFRILTKPVGNNTTSPGATLNFQYLLGATTTNILSMNSAGVISFAPTQTFPGTISSVSANSPITATTTSGAVALSLNTTALETTLNSVYPQLATGNVFSSYLEAYQTSGPGDAAFLGWGSMGSAGVRGDSDTGYGVQGESISGFGVYSKVTDPVDGSAGVLGFTGDIFSNTYSAEVGIANAGVWADNSNAGNSIPISLFATGDDVYGAGIVTNGADFPALYVINDGGTAGQLEAYSGYGVSATTGTGTGVYGQTSGGGSGMKGLNIGTSQQEAGVLGIANFPSNTYLTFNVYAGTWGDTGTSSTDAAPARAVGVLGTADDSYAGVFLNNSSTQSTLYVSNASTGGTGQAAGLFKTFMAKSADGTCGIGSGGSLSCTGQIKSLNSAGNGARTVETYAVQSPENWMEDFGSGKLVKGVAVVSIDPAFSDIVAGGADYHVFLTPRADSKGLYVINTTPTTFEVRESGGGTSFLAFDYRIVAKRRGYESERLLDVTQRFQDEQKAASMVRSSGVHNHPAPLPASRLHNPGVISHPRVAVPMKRPVSIDPAARR